MSGYDQYKGARTSWGINALGSVIAEVESDDGHIGVGVTIGGEPAAYIIENHLRCIFCLKYKRRCAGVMQRPMELRMRACVRVCVRACLRVCVHMRVRQHLCVHKRGGVRMCGHVD